MLSLKTNKKQNLEKTWNTFFNKYLVRLNMLCNIDHQQNVMNGENKLKRMGNKAAFQSTYLCLVCLSLME